MERNKNNNKDKEYRNTTLLPYHTVSTNKNNIKWRKD